MNRTLAYTDKQLEVFGRNLDKVMVNLEREILEILRKVEGKTGTDAFKAAVMLNQGPEMIKALKRAGYYALAESHLKTFEDLVGQVRTEFEEMALPPARFTKLDRKTFSDLAGADLEEFVKLGDQAMKDLRLGLYRSVLTGMPFKTLVDQIKASTTGTAKNGAPLRRWSYTHANTAMLRFSGQVIQAAGDNLEAENWEVVGPLDGVTRPACVAALADPIRKKEDWQKIGYFGGCPGGWNCRHQLYPYFAEIPKKEKPAKPKQAKTKKPKKAAAKPKAAAAEFTPAKSVAAAEKWAREMNLADVVDYNGLALETVNEINKALFETFKEFPGLRKNFEFVGTIRARNIRWIDSQLSRIKSNYSYLGNDEDQTKRAKKYLRGVLKRSGAYPGDCFAQASYGTPTRGIAFNDKRWFSEEKLEDYKRAAGNCVDSKFHPIGCHTIRSVVDHEIGHQLDLYYGVEKNTDFRNFRRKYGFDREAIKFQLSGYANKNDREFIAEAWAEYKNNPEPRRIAKTVGDLIYKLRGPL